MIFWKRIKAVINDLWYPRSVTVGKPVETQELAKRLARESTVAPADVHAVFRIEGVGWFRYNIVAAKKGVPTEEEVSSDQITELRIRFTPERTRNMSGGYDRAMIADDGIVFMEWLGKDSDETKIPDEEDGGDSESPDEV